MSTPRSQAIRELQLHEAACFDSGLFDTFPDSMKAADRLQRSITSSNPCRQSPGEFQLTRALYTYRGQIGHVVIVRRIDGESS